MPTGLPVYGLVDLVLEVHLDIHDWQALIAVVQGACGVLTTRKLPRYAVAESFSEVLKRERIRRKNYGTREWARQDVVNYIEVFYIPKRRRSFSNDLSPVEYEKQHVQRLACV